MQAESFGHTQEPLYIVDMAQYTFTHRLIYKLSSSNLSAWRPPTRHIGWAAKTPQPQPSSEDFTKKDRAKDAQACEFDFLKQEGFDFRPSDTLPLPQNVSEPSFSGWIERPLAKSPAGAGSSVESLGPHVPQAAIDVSEDTASLLSTDLHFGTKHDVAGALMGAERLPVTAHTALHSNPNPYYRGALQGSHLSLAARPWRRGAGRGAAKGSHTREVTPEYAYETSSSRTAIGASSSAPSFASLPPLMPSALQSRRQRPAHLGGRHVRPPVRSPPPPVPSSVGITLPRHRMYSKAEQKATDLTTPPKVSAKDHHTTVHDHRRPSSRSDTDIYLLLGRNLALRTTLTETGQSSSTHLGESSTLHSPTALLPFTLSASKTSTSARNSEEAIADALNLSSADSMAMRNLGARVQRYRHSTLKVYREELDAADELLQPEAGGFDFIPQSMTSRTNLAAERSECSERIGKHITQHHQHVRPRSMTAPRQQVPAWVPALSMIVDEGRSSAGMDSDGSRSDSKLTLAVVDRTGHRSAMQEEFEGIYEAIALSITNYRHSEIRVVDVISGARRSY